MELISKEEVIKITKKYDTTIYDAAMWCRKEIEELKTYTPLGSVLDKIKDEFIDRYPRNYANELELGGRSCVFSLNEILRIIDKYRAESEEV